jgi:purine-cytosine permease-like protein
MVWNLTESPRANSSRHISSIPVLFNLATLVGFCVIMAVLGGQCLSAVADGNLSSSVGIVIVALLSLVISFCGFSVLHVYERYAWIPALIAIIVATGTGGFGLKQQSPVEAAATASGVLSYGMVVASYMIPWACMASDFTTYLEPSTPP